MHRSSPEWKQACPSPAFTQFLVILSENKNKSTLTCLFLLTVTDFGLKGYVKTQTENKSHKGLQANICKNMTGVQKEYLNFYPMKKFNDSLKRYLGPKS